ncbi:hypothetical protein [Sphingomonas sp. 3-13AW]|jgi:hypothetical protein|uniref:hypothetical protein n=1 Tax=Sphingomonas sp. 3-13AW TaxID=3050450 RepID=UPI003BB7F718
MTWDYMVATLEGGFLKWKREGGEDHSQSLQGGLDYLGSQRWELVTALTKTSLGMTAETTLIFKRPKG